jgi:DNA-binding GntR family transcriptional regulator
MVFEKRLMNSEIFGAALPAWLCRGTASTAKIAALLHKIKNKILPTKTKTPVNKPDRTTAAAGGAVREAIYERIWGALLEHRLPPGTQLVEDRLTELFSTSRSQVRDVLARLAHQGLVDILPHRGAFIATPSPEQTREVFEARRLIEPALVRRLIGVNSASAIRALKKIVAAEQAARLRQDRPAMVRLSGEFHIKLAESAGNQTLTRNMRELASLTCLAIFLYDAPNATACREDEHANIVQAIQDQQTERAVALMLEHLDHIESSLDMSARPEEDIDLAKVLGGR